MANCKKCDGYGVISCGVCWGGQTQIRCKLCDGRGFIKDEAGEKITCPDCNGLKKMTPHSCPKCGNARKCFACGGVYTRDTDKEETLSVAPSSKHVTDVTFPPDFTRTRY